MTLAGTGDITGTALDSTGTPLNIGTVTYTNEAWARPSSFSPPCSPTGATRYAARRRAVRAAARRRQPRGRRHGFGRGRRGADHQHQHPSRRRGQGRRHGQVEDGAAPVVGADVVVTLSRASGGQLRSTRTPTRRGWSVENVPLGTVSVPFADAASRGIANASGIALATNGQTVDFGEMRLDATPIRVASVNPADGASDVSPLSATVTISFSEPAQPATVNGSTVRLLQGTGGVSASLSLSGDGRTVTLTPSARLADTTA